MTILTLDEAQEQFELLPSREHADLYLETVYCSRQRNLIDDEELVDRVRQVGSWLLDQAA